MSSQAPRNTTINIGIRHGASSQHGKNAASSPNYEHGTANAQTDFDPQIASNSEHASARNQYASANAVPYDKSHNTAGRVDRTYTINIDAPSAGGMMSGFDAIFKVLFLFAGWMLVAIAAICVPGGVLGALLGIFVAFSNLGVSASAVALALGCAIGCLGLSFPCAIAANRGFYVALAATRSFLGTKHDEASMQKARKSPGKTLVASLAIAGIGAAIAGIAVLLGGGDTIVLPSFLEAAFSVQPIEVADELTVSPYVSVSDYAPTYQQA